MKLNAMQMETLRKHISAKALNAMADAVVSAGAVETLTIVGKDGFIYDISEDGRLIPKNHNLQEDLAMKGIVKRRSKEPGDNPLDCGADGSYYGNEYSNDK
jgi:hypothetical protein